MLLLLLVAAAACSSTPEGQRRSEATPPGCGWVAASLVTGLMGDGTETTASSGAALPPTDKQPVSCDTTGPGIVRSLSISVQRHPTPLSLASYRCVSGWVYAGTPDKYSPACQTATSDGGMTRLLVRSGSYIISVVLSRRDRNWGGDPEQGLAISDQVTQRL